MNKFFGIDISDISAQPTEIFIGLKPRVNCKNRILQKVRELNGGHLHIHWSLFLYGGCKWYLGISEVYLHCPLQVKFQ